MDDFHPSSLAYLEELERRRLQDPSAAPAPGRGPLPAAPATAHGAGPASAVGLDERVSRLIDAYRVHGHRAAVTDPLGTRPGRVAELEPSFHGIGEGGLDQQLLDSLKAAYCGPIGTQFMHITDAEARDWLSSRLEDPSARRPMTAEEALRFASRLTDASVFEEFVGKRFLGAKRFSLEGGECLVPMLDLAIEKAAGQGVRGIVLAMAHRGRLNVLCNLIGKTSQEIFREFEDRPPERSTGGGDVKYHMGYNCVRPTASGGKVHLSLCFNPSHLEVVDPVAMGRVRAKQDRNKDRARERGLLITVHGDASMAGQGVVAEVFNLSRLAGYTVGGSLHLVVNNQVGFTTGPEEGRSSLYATDVARMLDIPVFHVHGEDPEALARVADLALDFRRTFRRDVVVDMVCYRRWGHNETDEPAFTQPVLYGKIRGRKSVLQNCLETGLRSVTREQAHAMAAERQAKLEEALAEAKSDAVIPKLASLQGEWKGYCGGPALPSHEAPTSVSKDRLVRLLGRLSSRPEGFKLHPKIESFLAGRAEMASSKRPLDWAACEALALASLADEGVRVRMSGEDTPRGTFSQRHAVVHDQADGRTFPLFSAISPGQAPVEIINSPLSELAALGFEYGYSLDCPDGLVLWEAQFGDFINMAQAIVDQFLASAEKKWERLSGLVLLLPHGLEGTGPEHASARLERFLWLCADDNIQVALPSTPAQYFHLLRRQALRKWRKPLVVMTPKGFLRHASAVSSLAELSEGGFHAVLPEPGVVPDPTRVRRVLVTSGKLFYELSARRQELGRSDVAIVRLEQFYPFPYQELDAELARYPAQAKVFWVQEEPENMGAWRYLLSRHCRPGACRVRMSGICRPESETPATGSAAGHRLEQEELIRRAFEEG